MEDLARIVALSELIPGWTRGEEARELARVSFSLADHPVIVEIGAFLGSGTVLLAGARRLRGTGEVHCVDPFDCSGDSFSVPYYQQIMAGQGGGGLRRHFEENMVRAGLADWVEAHQGRAGDVAITWRLPIDLLFMDGDHSRVGARQAYESWAPFLRRPGGILALHNSNGPREEGPDHDGHYRVVMEEVLSPAYDRVRLVGTTTFAYRSEATRLAWKR